MAAAVAGRQPGPTKAKGILKLDDRMRDTNDEGSAGDRFRLPKAVADAAKSDRPIPKISNVYEEIVIKGWELLKKERR